jgi:hypothetical protein
LSKNSIKGKSEVISDAKPLLVMEDEDEQMIIGIQ